MSVYLLLILKSGYDLSLDNEIDSNLVLNAFFDDKHILLNCLQVFYNRSTNQLTGYEISVDINRQNICCVKPGLKSKTMSGLPSTKSANFLTITRFALFGSTITTSLVAAPKSVCLYFWRLSSSLSASIISFNDFSGGGL